MADSQPFECNSNNVYGGLISGDNMILTIYNRYTAGIFFLFMLEN
jgi:hypothetical protein